MEPCGATWHRPAREPSESTRATDAGGQSAAPNPRTSRIRRQSSTGI